MSYTEDYSKFCKLRIDNAMILQNRMMELAKQIQFDKEIEETEEESEEDEDDEDEDYDDYNEDGDSPVQVEMFALMELYKVIVKEIGK